MATLNETPSSNRLHIGVFGRTNSGKSSIINALTKQDVSIVSDQKGTTTDPVYKPMEILPLGPCVIIDTAGFDDNTSLGQVRLEKTKLAAEKSDIAIIVLSTTDDFSKSIEWYKLFEEKKTPVLTIINKADLDKENALSIKNALYQMNYENIIITSTLTNEGIDSIKSELVRLLPEDYASDFITKDLVSEDDLVLLVMPQDIQAPKGRLILPQVQTIRELLDRKCIVMCTTTDKFTSSLTLLNRKPKLIITDSQVFSYVYDNKPNESMLTSFSVLFAALKGDLPYYIEGARFIDSLTEDSKVLIAECCTHAPLAEDIGRVKIPKMLKKRIGENLSIDLVSGTDFPDDPSEYNLIIQCGACMFNKKYVQARISKAKEHNVPMTNYGVTIAHITGILDKISY